MSSVTLPDRAVLAPPVAAAVPGRAAERPRPIELALVIPTFNESSNVPELLRRLDHALAGIQWEAVFVDDNSPDGTAALLRRLAQTDPRVRCIQRIGRRGLSTAVIEGVLSTAAPVVAVMDADLQHDETLLPRMLARMQQGDTDLVIGSRYVEGGGIGAWDDKRAAMSRFATRLSRLVMRQQVSDPMSGFFMTRRECFEQAAPYLSGQGYKILVDLLASSPTELRVAELPYTFRERFSGESKLDTAVLWQYAMLLLDKKIGRWVPVRFAMFALVGGTGVVVHFAALASLMAFGIAFAVAQTGATAVAMVSNFVINNLFTYRDRRLKGWAFVRGLFTFAAACSVGAAANVGAANFLFQNAYSWWLAGAAGVLIGVVWNYVATSILTWRH